MIRVLQIIHGRHFGGGEKVVFDLATGLDRRRFRCGVVCLAQGRLLEQLNAAGAAANRVALEACTEARNTGRDLEREGKDILTEAARHSPELKAAMETWKEIKFEFDTVDKLAAS